MNNKFKRALSSILAFVMLCSCMCVMNVSSVLATATTNVYNVDRLTSTSTSNGVAFFNANGTNPIKLIGKSGAVSAPAGSVSLETGKTAHTDVSLTKAILPSGGTNNTSNAYTVALTSGQTLGIYYTIVSGDFTDNSKYGQNKTYTGALKACASTATNTDLVNDTDSKKNIDTVYYDSFEATADDTYYLYSSNNRLIAYAFVIIDADTVPTSDVYNWTVGTNENLNIKADEISFESGVKTSTFENTLSYSGSKYTVNTIPTLKNSITGVSIDKGTQIGTSDFMSYNVTVTLQEDWFTAKPTYAVSGTIYDSSTVKALTNATVKATDGTATVNSDGTFTVSGIIGETTLTVSADNYATKTLTYSEATSDVVVDLVPKTISDGTNTATANKAYARASFTATKADNIDSFNGYEINGFKFSTGGIKLQMVDSKDNTTGAKYNGFDYVGRFNLSNGDYYISYTPSEDGVLNIIGKTGSNNDIDRGVVVKQGDKEVKKQVFTSNDMYEVPVTVTANTEYKIYAVTKAINIYELTFIPNFTIDTVASTSAVAHVKYNDTHYAVVTVSDIADVVKLSLAKGDIPIKDADIDTVYESVTFGSTCTAKDFNTSITSDGYVFAFAIDNNNSSDDTTIANAIKSITVSAFKSDATAE